MSTLGPLFSWEPPAQRHSPTSKAAARAVRSKANAYRDLVRAAIASAPDGLTDEEIIERTGLPQNTARPRRVELMDRGEVVQDGKRRTRSGRFAAVWVMRP